LPTIKFDPSSTIVDVEDLNGELLIGLTGGVIILFDLQLLKGIPCDHLNNCLLKYRECLSSFKIRPVSSEFFVILTEQIILMCRKTPVEEGQWKITDVSNTHRFTDSEVLRGEFWIAHRSDTFSVFRISNVVPTLTLNALKRPFWIPISMDLTEEVTSTYFPKSEAKLLSQCCEIHIQTVHTVNLTDVELLINITGSLPSLGSELFLFQNLVKLGSPVSGEHVENYFITKRICLGSAVVKFLDGYCFFCQQSSVRKCDLLELFNDPRRELSFDNLPYLKQLHLNISNSVRFHVCSDENRDNFVTLQTLNPEELIRVKL
jgi:hypothetical protein